MADTLGRAPVQRELNRLEKWPDRYLKKLRDKYKVLLLSSLV